MKPKTKPCLLCRKDINLDEDNYVRLTDYFKGEQYSEGFYHNQCYNDRLKKGNAMQKMAFSLFNRTNKILDKVDGEPEVIYKLT